MSHNGDGKQVKAVVGSTTTYGACPERSRRVGAPYQVDNGVITKYYLAGASRIAMRKGTTLYYLLSDHASTMLSTSLGSTSLALNSSGTKIAELRYRAWGETRFSSGTTYTACQFREAPCKGTSQRNETSLGLYFYNARWYDPSLGRFTSADTIVPTQTQGTQAWDRYAFVNNNPVRYTDPTGHMIARCLDDDCGSGGGSSGDGGSSGGGSSGSGSSSSSGNRDGRSSGNPGDELEDIVQEEDNPIEAYCGDASTLSCISMALQDASFFVDLVFVGVVEVPLVAAGCFGGGLAGCAAGEIAAAEVWNSTGNWIDIGLSWASTGFTIADDLLNNGGITDNSVTSVSASLAGLMAPTASTDLIVDTYVAGYNHGFFNGLMAIGNGASIFNW